MLQIAPVSQLSAHLQATAWMAGIAIILTWIAERMGFFKWNKPQGQILISTPSLIELLGLYLIISYLGPVLLIRLIMPISSSFGIARSELPLFVMTALQLSVQILFVFLASLYAFAHKRIDLRKIIKNSPSPIFIDIGIGILAWLVSFPAVAAIDGLMEAFNLYFFGTQGPAQNAITFILMLMKNPKYLWMGILITIVFAPIIEEFVFRGCVQTYLRNRLPRMQAIVLSALTFSLAHFSLTQGIGNIPLLTSIFAFGLYLGFVYERQRSLYASIALHATFNAISIARLVFWGG